ncbi:hypothetical protein GF312_08755 [Candidatus Poribacteria bacterium]|nr:hypothetical protein [Candidatus Poribacteria bacterium]
MIIISNAAYSEVKLSGSSYNETSMVNSDEAFRYGNRSNLHLKFLSKSKGAKLTAELDFYMLYGYLVSITAQSILPQSTSIVTELMKDGQFYVDRLYLTLPFSIADIRIGKQRIAWGSGVIFRPTDNFNRPNPLSISGRKEGVNSLSAEFYTGSLSSAEFVIAPADTFNKINGEINLEHLKYSKFASRYITNLHKTDMAFSYQYSGEPENHIIGVDLKGDIELGYHVEGVFIYNNDSFSGDSIEEYFQGVFGLDYSFAEKWVVLGEYFYNGPGMDKETDLSSSNFSLLDEFNYRHYLYSQVSYQHDIFIGANALYIINMIDKSSILSPAINYSLFQNTDLNISGQFFFGDKADEFSPDRLEGSQIYYLKLTVKF